jgi:hypothetical protein
MQQIHVVSACDTNEEVWQGTPSSIGKVVSTLLQYAAAVCKLQDLHCLLLWWWLHQ